MEKEDLRAKLRAKISLNKMGRLPKEHKEQKIEELKTKFADIMKNMNLNTTTSNP
jgi:hypothetical protein